jgi:hypothetical protein
MSGTKALRPSRVDFPDRLRSDHRRVKLLSLLIVVLLFALAPARAAEKPKPKAPTEKPADKKRFALYGMLLDNIPVDLADGAQWMMDKGDTFPVIMFKEAQTKVLLQLAGTNFLVETKHVKVIDEKNLTAGELASYRRNVQTYIDTRSDQWKQRAAKK